MDTRDGKGESARFLDDSVFNSVLASRPFAAILPNLRYLVVRNQGSDFSRARQFVFTLSKSIKRLDVHVLNMASHVENLAYFLQEAADRAPNIRHITFSDWCRNAAFEERIQELFPKFLNLESILLSSCTLNATMLSALSSLPLLNEIRLRDFGENHRMEDVRAIDGAVLGGCPFPSLRFFTLQTQLPSATKFLSTQINLSTLVRLSLDIISHISVDVLSDFLELVAQNCHCMTQLALFRIEDCEDLASRGDPITAEALKGLKSMTSLETFTLSSTRHFNMSDLELARIILSCRNLRCLRLQRDPLTVTKAEASTLTLNLLSILADSGEGFSLDELCLDFDIGHPPCPRPLNSPTLHVGKLLFGYSVLPRSDVFKVASFLDSIIDRKSFSMDLGIVSEFRQRRVASIFHGFEFEFEDGETGKELRERRELWNLVSEAMDFISETRARSEEEIMCLQRSNTILRMELDEVKQELRNASD